MYRHVASHVCMFIKCMQYPRKPEEVIPWVRSPGTEVTESLEAPLWLLGIKLVPFGREAIALNHGDISPAQSLSCTHLAPNFILTLLDKGAKEAYVEMGSELGEDGSEMSPNLSVVSYPEQQPVVDSREGSKPWKKDSFSFLLSLLPEACQRLIAVWSVPCSIAIWEKRRGR